MKTAERRRFSFSELTIDVSWDDLLSENELGLLLSLVPFCKSQRPDRQIDIELVCTFVDEAFQISGSAFRTTTSYGLSISNKTDQTIITDGNSAFSIDHPTGKGRITFHPFFAEKSPLAKSNFFLIGLIHLLAQYGYYDLHGAGLIDNGNSCLLLGPSGSGKSSLALNLVKHGYGYASDDALLLKANENDVSVLSFRKHFYVDRLLAKRYPELECLFEHPDQKQNDKCFIDLEDVWPGRFKPQIVPSKIVFCRVSGAETSRIQPISKTDALLRLLPQSASIFFNKAFAQKQVAALRRLIEQTNSFQLDAGLDVYGNPRRAADLLSGV